MAAVRGGGGGCGEDDKDAKYMFDRIGKEVLDKVKNESANYVDDLKGLLTSATLSGGERASSLNPCSSDYTTRFDASSNRHPCGNRTGKEEVNRFSKESGGECDEKKIKDSNNYRGACAPYRRLSLCNKNFQKINNIDSDKARHNLLVDVCMAANYEAQSLKTYRDQYDAEYSSVSTFTMCTMLARSFADIGDIVRGRDLYFGKRKKKNQNGKETETERDQLENKLKEIFTQIYKDVTSTNDQTKKPALQKRYNDTTDYFQLREDWWTANRATIWKAMTCSKELDNSSYFHATCSDSHHKGSCSQANKYCRCNKDNPDDDKQNIDPPTYFDYVPQFLRWFEEWAEDFCRKKNKKIKDVKRNCRGVKNEKYCSRNGFDCEKTKRAVGKYRMGKQCISCLFACNPYVEWIDNQRKQFLKQKNKYDEEITRGGSTSRSGNGRQRRAARSSGSNSNYDGYESKFYKIFKVHYSDVNKFLEKLSKENVCEQITTQEEGRIDFKNVKSSSASGGTSDTSGTNDARQGTFYRSKYCQPCPYCGMKKKLPDKEWEEKSENENCKNIKLYKPNKDATPTDNTILKSGEGKEEIKQKIDDFCTKTQNGTDSGSSGGSNSEKKELYDEWKCYEFKDLQKDGKGVEDEDDLQYDKDVENAGGLCILKNTNKKEKEKESEPEPNDIQKTFYDFFTYWVAHMLKDSIHWRTKKIKGCLENGTKTRCNKKNNCKDDCQCFQRWIDKKKTEWGKIKEHFKKQKDFKNEGQSGKHKMLGEGMESADVVLEWNLKLQFLKKDSTEDSAQDTQSRDEDAEEMKHLKKILKLEDENTPAVVNAGTGKRTLMDKLIEYEEKEAEKCKDCQEPQKPQEQERGGAGRNLPAVEKTIEEDEEDDDDEDDEEEEEEEKEEEPQKEEGATEGPAKGETPQGPPTTPEDNVEKVCDTVAEALKTSLTDACKQKYGGNNSRLGWKCIPSDTKSVATGSSGVTTTTSGDTGGLCIPPRRRKLYLGGFKRLTDGTTEASSEATSATSQSPNGDLLTAFVESAAIETFFLWDRYKKEWDHRNKAQNGLLGAAQPLIPVPVTDSDDSPQSKLEKGEIPTDFLRQMFYTLGDYRDILVRGGITGDSSSDKDSSSSNHEKNLVVLLSENKQEMKQIQQKIDEILNKQSGNNQQSGQKSVTTRQTLWGDFAQYIWNGMICALTYKENGSDKPTVDQEVYGMFFGKPTGTIDNPGSKPKTNGTYQENYDYNSVKLDNSDTQAKTTGGENTPLTDFISRPPYFRYLEEWGETFCKERKKRLKKIKGDCKVDDDKYKCSGFGEDCKNNLNKPPSTLSDLECPDCARHCSFYKKWINTKRDEFNKQSNAYSEQQKNCEKETTVAKSNDNGFCGTLKNTSRTAAEFLERLKNGPCKKDNENGGSDINFTNTNVTFGHETYCDPCSQFRVKCENGKCSNGDGTKVECNGTKKNSIDANHIIDDKNGNGNIEMLVSDDNTNGFDGDLNEACKNANIFKGIRKDQWKCRNVCGYVVCKPENGNTETGSGQNGNDKHIITIRGLVEHWVQNFLEDYNRIRKKLKACMKNGKGSTCTSDCVKEWIGKKRGEWETIRGRFNDQYNVNGSHDDNVRSVLEKFEHRPEFKKAIKPCPRLDELQKSRYCNATANTENDIQKDVVLCLLDKLKKDAEKCKTQTSGQTCTQSTSQQTLEDDETFDDDIETENTVEAPNICPQEEKKEQKNEEEKCDEKEEEEEKKEGKDKGDEAAGGPVGPQEPSPKADSDDQIPKEEKNKQKSDENIDVKPPKPRPQPQPPKRTLELLDNPLLKTALMSSTIMWSVGIGFAAFTYFYLKKKTKASVGNLFQILQIPKSDYDIPTKLSPNRYIPYTSGKYRGKRYIYLEGDSGTDSGYTDHYSDITSSSESEYEELDINEIYPYQSPKYKTLIEVVLEPSGNNTTASGKNTPSDTQNDIHNDGIPSSKITDNEWNTLKDEFISQYVQRESMGVPQYDESTQLPMNIVGNVFGDKMDEKPFITSIHDRNLYTGEEYSYNVNMVNTMDDIPMSDKNDVYSGIDLINDSLNSGNQPIDIYDELLKRKENELFGTNHVKQTSIHSVAKLTNSDPIHNQLELFHKWLDRHRDMCEQWDKNKKEELLDKLKEEWENETHSGNKHSDIPSGKLSDTPSDNNIHSDIHPSDIPSGKLSDIPSDNNIHSDIPYVLNTDVSIQIHMDNPKTTNEFTYVDSNPNQVDDTYVDSNPDNSSMDTILEDLDKPFNEPYYYDVQDDIYYDVNDHDTSTVDSNNMDVPSKVQIEMDVNTKLVKEKYPIADVWDI